MARPRRKTRKTKFYEMSRKQRLDFLKRFTGLSKEDLRTLRSGSLSFTAANSMVENVIGTAPYPLGTATGFLINGKEYMVPMAIEEPSVIAAASKGAKMAGARGGFAASADPSVMMGQIQVVGLKDGDDADDGPAGAGERILAARERILEAANAKSRTLSRIGAGAKDLSYRIVDTPERGGRMLIVELGIDVKDAMGANVVNTMCEAVAPIIEELAGGRVLLRILSNYAAKRLARAEAVFGREELGGSDVVDGILLAYAFAAADQYRCTTHNKGVMNGIIAVANATGQDTRAIEAGAHSFACRDGKYNPLTRWTRNAADDLVGSIELPLAVGTVGGASIHPVARTCLKILRVRSAQELACVMASVGLAQNLAALRALVTEGIQKGHMRLHARHLAMMAGADEMHVDAVAERISGEKNVTLQRARQVLRELRKKTATGKKKKKRRR
ncbi:MAG: hydroxymethylglutaryl-CoA reductase, degradative [Nitrososphaerales archaeon]